MTEHPADRAQRIRAAKNAKKVIDDFVARHQKKLVALVQTYEDSKAEELLRKLREKFWCETVAYD